MSQLVDLGCRQFRGDGGGGFEGQILVRVGEQILRLRRPQLIKARDIVFRLNEYRRNAARTGNKEKKTPDFAESPLVAEWKYQSVDGGTVKAWYSNSNPEKPGLLEIGAVTLDVYVCNFSGDNSNRAHALFDEVIGRFAPDFVEKKEVARGHLGSPLAD